jgi:uncharacterized phiE125 gp8 family phage protein
MAVWGLTSPYWGGGSLTSARLTVVTPATSTLLATLAAAKAELGITGTDDDSILTRFLTQASATIPQYCHRVFAQEIVAEVFRLTDGEWPASLLLRRYPVTAIASVVADGTTLAMTEYEVDSETGLLWHLCEDERLPWWWYQKLVVTYTAGYVLPTSVPGDLERCCLDLVKFWYFARSRDPALRSEKILDVIDQSWNVGSHQPTADGLPVEIAGRLARWQMPLA